MRDEEEGHAELGLQIGQEVDHSGLDRHVQCRDGLVEHQQLGLERQCPGDADALALAAGELVGVAIGVGGLEPDQPEHLGDPCPYRRAVGDPVDLQRLGDGGTDRESGIERGERILEDDLDVAAHAAHLLPVERRQLGAVEAHRARRGPDELEHCASGGRLATSRLAHQAKRLARSDGERDAAHGVDLADPAAHERPTSEREVLDQVGHLEQRRGGARRCSTRGGSVHLAGHDVGTVRAQAGAAVGEEPSVVAPSDGGREVAGGPVCSGIGGDRRHHLQHGLGGQAHLGHQRAAGCEGAPAPLAEHGRRRSRDLAQAFGPVAVEPGQRAQQAQRVGHGRRIEDVLGRPHLDRSSGVHHEDPVGQSGDHAEVVGDQQQRRAGLGQRRPERVEHLGLHRHVECGRGLVGQDHLGVVGHGDGDDGALTHATGEFMGIAVDTLGRFRDAHLGQELDGPGPRCLLGDVLMGQDRLGDLPPDRVHRVQRGHGVLEDHGDPCSADGGQLLLLQAEQLVSLEA